MAEKLNFVRGEGPALPDQVMDRLRTLWGVVQATGTHKSDFDGRCGAAADDPPYQMLYFEDHTVRCYVVVRLSGDHDLTRFLARVRLPDEVVTEQFNAQLEEAAALLNAALSSGQAEKPAAPATPMKVQPAMPLTSVPARAPLPPPRITAQPVVHKRTPTSLPRTTTSDTAAVQSLPVVEPVHESLPKPTHEPPPAPPVPQEGEGAVTAMDVEPLVLLDKGKVPEHMHDAVFARLQEVGGLRGEILLEFNGTYVLQAKHTAGVWSTGHKEVEVSLEAVLPEAREGPLVVYDCSLFFADESDAEMVFVDMKPAGNGRTGAPKPASKPKSDQPKFTAKRGETAVKNRKVAPGKLRGIANDPDKVDDVVRAVGTVLSGGRTARMSRDWAKVHFPKKYGHVSVKTCGQILRVLLALKLVTSEHHPSYNLVRFTKQGEAHFVRVDDGTAVLTEGSESETTQGRKSSNRTKPRSLKQKLGAGRDNGGKSSQKQLIVSKIVLPLALPNLTRHSSLEDIVAHARQDPAFMRLLAILSEEKRLTLEKEGIRGGMSKENLRALDALEATLDDFEATAAALKPLMEAFSRKQ